MDRYLECCWELYWFRRTAMVALQYYTILGLKFTR